MTATHTERPLAEVLTGYFAMWNETDPERRDELIAGSWTPDATYVDPKLAAGGHDQLAAMVAGVQAHFPGHTFRPIDTADVHNARARWGWELTRPDGTAVVTGVDFARLAPDGRLRDVTGFFVTPGGAA